jgi:hypothetical protein
MNERMQITANGEVYYVNAQGGIEDDDDQLQVSAKEVERIYAAATAIKKACPRELPKVTGDHAVSFTNPDYDAEPGDVWIGCQQISYHELTLALKVSRRMRAKNKGKK